MTLDEAIAHCEETAASTACSNGRCSAEHAQLAAWLKELRALKAGGAA